MYIMFPPLGNYEANLKDTGSGTQTFSTDDSVKWRIWIANEHTLILIADRCVGIDNPRGNVRGRTSSFFGWTKRLPEGHRDFGQCWLAML